jgi:alkylation response protein AidB-like acyl-CoA dehydrogenase
VAIGITDEHEALRATARRWLESRCPNTVPRALLDVPDDDPAAVALPPFWKELADQGWLGLHVPEEHGGSGYGLVELAVVLEELGRASAPGPFLPSALAAAVIAEGGDDSHRADWLPKLADGSLVATVALAVDDVAATAPGSDGSVVLSGMARPVVAGGSATLLLVPVDGMVCAVTVDDDGVAVKPVESLDATRRLSEVAFDAVVVPRSRQLRGITDERVRDLAAVMFTAEAAGVAGWCLDTTNAYAKVREQFGRPFGQFQAVKHRLADMLVMAEQARSVAWDASAAGEESLPVAVAGALALDNAVEAAKWCVQLHGGIGFTWEHDAHLYLKRALAVRQLLGGGGHWRARVARLALDGARRDLHLDLPPEAEATRAQVQSDAEAAKAIGDATERRAFLADRGYLAPNWPSPYGRDAGPIEQLVIDEEFRGAKVRIPHLSVGAWALPTIITHGTVEQQERFCGPTLRGEMNWCQMFSEPGAGSDLASLTTKAVKVDGGWSVSGQKVWTSMARDAQWAILLARTNPTAPKHNGITYFLLDMAADGIDIRPLRELTGVYWFNEIFLSDVFVPDDCVVGEVDDGWKLARTTLANERVSMGSGSSFGYGVEAVLDLVGDASTADPLVLDQVGGLLAEAQSLALLGFRTTLRQLSGADPGPESSVRKLLGVEHEQRVQEFGLSLLGAEGATVEGVAGVWTNGFLANRCLTIAGGTSEVQRNVIAERLLGLPRDP